MVNLTMLSILAFILKSEKRFIVDSSTIFLFCKGHTAVLRVDMKGMYSTLRPINQQLQHLRQILGIASAKMAKKKLKKREI